MKTVKGFRVKVSVFEGCMGHYSTYYVYCDTYKEALEKADEIEKENEFAKCDVQKCRIVTYERKVWLNVNELGKIY